MTVTDFLTARFDEDEAVARAAIADDMGETGGFEDAYEILIEPPSGVGIAQGGFGEAAARMICTYAVPTRVLREVEAKRAIVADGDLWSINMAEQVLSYLATVYSDHPDYDEAWRP